MSETVKTYEWEDVITDDGMEQEEIVLLPEGNYTFEVVKSEKGYFDGSDKSPACNKATITFRIDGGEHGKGLATETFLLTSRQEWKAAEFLRSTGMKKHGDGVQWGLLVKCVGKTGRCKVTVNEYVKNGENRKNNHIDKFYDIDEASSKKAFKKGAF